MPIIRLATSRLIWVFYNYTISPLIRGAYRFLIIMGEMIQIRIEVSSFRILYSRHHDLHSSSVTVAAWLLGRNYLRVSAHLLWLYRRKYRLLYASLTMRVYNGYNFRSHFWRLSYVSSIKKATFSILVSPLMAESLAGTSHRDISPSINFETEYGRGITTFDRFLNAYFFCLPKRVPPDSLSRFTLST